MEHDGGFGAGGCVRDVERQRDPRSRLERAEEAGARGQGDPDRDHGLGQERGAQPDVESEGAQAPVPAEPGRRPQQQRPAGEGQQCAQVPQRAESLERGLDQTGERAADPASLRPESQQFGPQREDEGCGGRQERDDRARREHRADHARLAEPGGGRLDQ